MRKGLTVLIIMIVIAISGFLITGGPARKGAKVVEGEALTENFTVEVVEVVRGNIKQTTELNVTFAPYSSVPLIPKTGGTVVEVLAATGDQVKKGQTLFVIDDTQLKLLEKGASTEDLKQIEATVLQAKASSENIEAEYQRMEELYQKEMIPKKQLEAVELQRKIAATNLTAAQARLTAAQKGASEEQRNILKSQVKQAETALEMAKLQLSYTKVAAPISGVLAQFNVEVGGMAAPAAPAGLIVDNSRMKAKAVVPESYINNLKVGEKVTIEAKALPGSVFTGTITAVSPLAEQATRQFPVEFSVVNSSQALKAGMLGTTHLTIGEATNVPLIPVSTVLYEREKPYVFVVEEGLAVRRNIKIGLNSGEMVSVLEGLNEGTMVISRGQHQVKNGMLVEVK